MTQKAFWTNLQARESAEKKKNAMKVVLLKKWRRLKKTVKEIYGDRYLEATGFRANFAFLFSCLFCYCLLSMLCF